MGDNGTIPVYYTMEELKQLYRKRKITYKELMLYEHCPNKIPIKEYKIVENFDTKTI